jgi:hypothetical protein
MTHVWEYPKTNDTYQWIYYLRHTKMGLMPYAPDQPAIWGKVSPVQPAIWGKVSPDQPAIWGIFAQSGQGLPHPLMRQQTLALLYNRRGYS